MIKPKVIVTVGISNSGKSTWAREFIKENPHFVDINRDDLRIALHCGGDRAKYAHYRFSDYNESVVTSVAEKYAETAVERGKGVIISDTNLGGKYRAAWKRFATWHSLPYEEKVFDTPLHICKKRNQKRDITIPESALIRQWKGLRKYLDKPTYERNNELRPAVIFDIDGTLAHMGSRGPFEWTRVGEDGMDLHVYELLNMYERRGYEIIIMSGRDGVCRPETEEWLKRRDVPYTELLMRKEGDDRPDVIIKEELFWTIADQYAIRLAVDDRDQVVDMWRSIGIKCFQVEYGDF